MSVLLRPDTKRKLGQMASASGESRNDIVEAGLLLLAKQSDRRHRVNLDALGL